MSTRLPTQEFFASHPVFGALTPAEFERIFRHARMQSHGRGEPIFARGDSGTGLIAILRGTVKISVLSTDGREIVLNLLGEGQILGEIALLDGRERSADATAWSDCELLVLDRRDFLPALREAPDLSIRIMELLCARLRHATEQVEDLLFLDLPGRLAKAVLRLRESQNDARVRITQRELGVLIGMSRERINKQLRRWEERRWIEIEKGGLLIRDGAALARQAAH